MTVTARSTGYQIDLYKSCKLMQAYLLAYLETKGFKSELNEDGSYKEIRDDRTSFGTIDDDSFDSYLVKTDDDKALFFTTSISIINNRTPLLVEKKIIESYHQIIAKLLQNDVKELPADCFKILLRANYGDRSHHNVLSTSLSGISQEQYKELYDFTQNYKELYKESFDAARQESKRNEFGKYESCIKQYKREHDISNGVAIEFTGLELSYLNSTGEGLSYLNAIKANMSRVNAGLLVNIPVRNQSGQTCGDHTCFNGTQYALLGLDPRDSNVDSSLLRAFTENISVENAAQVLYSKEPKLQAVKAPKITNIQRALEKSEVVPVTPKNKKFSSVDDSIISPKTDYIIGYAVYGLSFFWVDRLLGITARLFNSRIFQLSPPFTFLLQLALFHSGKYLITQALDYLFDDSEALKPAKREDKPEVLESPKSASLTSQFELSKQRDRRSNPTTQEIASQQMGPRPSV